MIISHGELTTDIVAAAAVSSPLWLPTLQATSTFASMLWPILGGIWLFVQIIRALIQGWVAYDAWRHRPKK